jgi:hypothetical protein
MVGQVQQIIRKRYGFYPNLTQSPFQNAISISTSTNSQNPPLHIPNLAFHDLTDHNNVPHQTRLVLGLGLKFIQTPKYTTSDITTTLSRLRRDIYLKTFFAGEPDIEPNQQTSKLYVKSHWTPPRSDIPPQIDDRIDNFSTKMTALFKRKHSRSNLLPFQARILRSITANPNLLFPNSDKGLGPCAVTYNQYITDCLIHLQDTTTYKQLTKEEAFDHATTLHAKISTWLSTHKNHINNMDAKYIKQHLHHNKQNPFGQFYATYKIHKGMQNNKWPTRPVCSDVSSLPHGLGKWVDHMLQPIAAAQPSYLKDSFTLKHNIHLLHLPSRALLFTSDAKSMYTCIPTEPALDLISSYLRTNENNTFHHYNSNALIEALQIVFQNNLIQFGDTYWQQISGTGMGISPAPPWATIFYGLHEQQFLPDWSQHVIYYKRFIDDVFGIWLPHTDPIKNNELWELFKHRMQSWHGLEWEFTHPSPTCNFMDLTISISNSKITTTIYEKKQNLYLYIPPHSAHPSGIINGLIFGHILRLHRLCSNKRDIQQKSQEFFTRLIQRGHPPDTITPLFHHAHRKATTFMTNQHITTAEQPKPPTNTVFLHLPFHPHDPNRHTIQNLWNTTVAKPIHQTPLFDIRNLNGHPTHINRLTIAYSRPLNLGNQLSVRTIHGRGMPVSSYVNK